MLQTFAIWLEGTPISQLIQNQLWIIPALQIVHILAIAALLSSAGMISLRLLGRDGTGMSIGETADRYMPWIWSAIIILALTGSLLVTGEPRRSITNPAFQIKMAMLVIALCFIGGFAVRARHRSTDGQFSFGPPMKAGSLITMLLLLAIAVAGRWIAYVIVPDAY